MTVAIDRLPSEGGRPYVHLEPIVRALVAAGNRPVRPEGFFQDRDGWRCDLVDPIDFALVRREFELPPTILLAEDHDSILCRNTWIEIKGAGSPGAPPR